MQVKFKVKPKNGSEIILAAELVDLIAWEENFQRPSSQLSNDAAFARDYVWLAWHTAKRTNVTDLDFMDWASTLDDFESAEDDLVPLESPAHTGPSQP